MKNLKTCKSQGITIIALVITIIVLLILVGVSLSLVLGEEGLIGRTIGTKEVNENAEEKELVELAVSTAQIDGHGNLNETNLNNALKETFNNSNEVTPNSEGWDYEANKKYNIYPDGRVEDVGNVESILPEEYQQVEYIESTGTQFINTEIYPKSTTKVIFDFVYTDENSGGNGWGSAEGNEVFMWGTNPAFSSYVNSSWIRCNTNINNDYKRHEFILYSGNQLFDGVKYGDTIIGDTATNKQYMYLFAEHWEWDNRAGNYSQRCRRIL